MPVMMPKLPEALLPVADFEAYVRPHLEAENVVAGIQTGAAHITETDFYRLELRASVCIGLIFQNCRFERADFRDILFQDCNFSGCDFAEAYFERCAFQNCKAVGAGFSETLWKNNRLSESNFSYALFDRSTFRDVTVENSNLTGASFTGVKWQKPFLQNSLFVQNNFFGAQLAGADFSECIFEAPGVCDPPKELRGITVSAAQAAQLAALFGIHVRG